MSSPTRDVPVFAAGADPRLPSVERKDTARARTAPYVTHPADVGVVLLLRCTAGIGGLLPARSGPGRGLVPHLHKRMRGILVKARRDVRGGAI